MNASVIHKSGCVFDSSLAFLIQHYCLPNIANSTSNPIAIFLSQVIKNFAHWLLPQNLHCFFIFTVKSAKLYYILHPDFFFYNANYIMTSSINKNFSMPSFALWIRCLLDSLSSDFLWCLLKSLSSDFCLPCSLFSYHSSLLLYYFLDWIYWGDIG